MAKQGLKYPIELDDQATLVYQKFIGAVKSGEVDLSKVMDRARESTRKHGEEVSKLTRWIREERLEQRQHNFIFSQGREIVAAASVGLSAFGLTVGRTNTQMAALTNGLNQGFVAFQGMNNVLGLAGIGGPWGIAISAVAGLGAAFATIKQEANAAREKAAAAAKEIVTKALEARAALILGMSGIRQEIRELQRELGIRTAAQDYRDVAEELKNAEESYRRFAESLGGNATAQQAATLDLMYKKVLQLRIELGKIDVSREMPVAMTMEQVKPLLVHEQAMMRIAEIWKQPIKGVPLINAFDKWNEDLWQLTAKEQAFFSVLGSGISSVMGRARNDIRKLFGEANNYLTEFVSAVLEAIAEIVARQAAAAAVAGILTALTGGSFGVTYAALGGIFHDGGLVAAHSGMRIGGPPQAEMPILVRGGETVRTERQERDVQQKLNGGGGITINVYGPVADEISFKRIVERGMRKAGLSADEYFRNNRNTTRI